MHPDAMLAHLASAAAHEQGKFWEYHDKLFSNQRALKKDNLLEYARELGLDMPRFQQALDTARYQKLIEADTNEVLTLGANGTPAFFINGYFVSGAQPFPLFAQKINAELERLKIPIPEGAPGG